MHWIQDFVVLSLTAITSSASPVAATDARISHREPPVVGVFAALAEARPSSLAKVFEPTPAFSHVTLDRAERLEPKFGRGQGEEDQIRSDELRGVAPTHGAFGKVQPLGRIGFERRRAQ